MSDSRATSQDVADLAGVSRSAVSLVLNGRADGMISAVKQDAIRKAARALSYVPNAVALSLRTRRTSTIGVVTDTADSVPSISATLLGAGIRAMQDGYLLLIIGLTAVEGAEDQAWQILRTRQVDGLLFVAASLSRRPSPSLLTNVPSAQTNCVDAAGAVPSVIPDEAAGVALLVGHLADHGHRRIAMITPPADTETSRTRVRGFQAAVQARGLSVLGPVAAGNGVSDGYAAGLRLLSAERRPTAIIASGDRCALGVSLAAAQLGLGIPVDLSLVAIEEDAATLGTMVPAITAVRQPYVEIGRLALERVLSRLDAAPTDGEVEPELVTGELVVRESVTFPAEH